MHAIGNALLGGATSSLCALNCDAFNVPLGAANLDLSSKGLGAAAATLLAGVIKGNTTITSLKCVQPRISHMVDQCMCLIQALSLAVLASNSVSTRFCKPPPWSGLLLCQCPLTLLLSHHPRPTHDSLVSNRLCGLYYELGEVKGTYTTEGITKLCEGLKGSAVTSLKCAATP